MGRAEAGATMSMIERSLDGMAALTG